MRFVAAALVALAMCGAAQGAENDPCTFYRFNGTDGYVHVQSSGPGHLAWSVDLWNHREEAGRWVVEVFAGSRRVQRVDTVRPYGPHSGFRDPRMRAGMVIRLTFFHVSPTGRRYYGTVKCRMARR